MNVKYKIAVLFVFALAGFMIAIQFRSFQEPEQRDTRDTWELRADIHKQQKLQQQLYTDIQKAEDTIDQYEKNSTSEAMKTLKHSVKELKHEAGLTEVVGDGVIFTLKPMFEENFEIQTYPNLSPQLLIRFKNELNKYGATDIAIANERIISLSPIRDVNGSVYVNNHPLPALPIKITVLADNPEKLLGYMEYSAIRDNFATESIELSGAVKQGISVPKYDQEIHLNGIDLSDVDDMDGE